MEDKLSLLIKIAQQRSGLVLLDDLKQLHFSPSAITRLVSRGILRRVHRGMVYALSDEHLNFEAEIAAACFAVPESWASGVSAAQYWGIRRVPRDRVEISVNTKFHPNLTGVRIRRVNLPEPEIVTSIHGWSVSSPQQTLFEIALEVDDRTLLSAYEDCLNRELVTMSGVREFGSRAVKMGRHGSAVPTSSLALRWTENYTTLPSRYTETNCEICKPRYLAGRFSVRRLLMLRSISWR
jgi:hypothetical protein